MNDGAVFAQDPDAVNIILGAHILDDLVDVGWLVLQHREARAFGDHFRQLGDMANSLLQEFRPVVAHYQRREQKHGDHQCDD
jgi:hypothetical protein